MRTIFVCASSCPANTVATLFVTLTLAPLEAGSVTRAEILEKAMAELGFTRGGKNIEDTLERVIVAAEQLAKEQVCSPTSYLSSSAKTSPMILVILWGASGSPPSASATSSEKASTE